MKSGLLIAFLAALPASPVHAQFLGGSAADEETVPLGETPLPEGRKPDRTTKPPQQVDFSAPEQVDFNVDAALPDTPVDRGNRTPAGRPVGRIDRGLDRIADEPVDSLIGGRTRPGY